MRPGIIIADSTRGRRPGVQSSASPTWGRTGPILRRLDRILEPTRDTVRALDQRYSGGGRDVQVRQKTGFRFYNTSEWARSRARRPARGWASKHGS